MVWSRVRSYLEIYVYPAADTSKKKGGGKKKKSKEDVKDEAFEDSDDGDGEGRELEYMSDESSEVSTVLLH